jgi:hypothetical protein
VSLDADRRHDVWVRGKIQQGAVKKKKKKKKTGKKGNLDPSTPPFSRPSSLAWHALQNLRWG